jgi:hypothetical protein
MAAGLERADDGQTFIGDDHLGGWNCIVVSRP